MCLKARKPFKWHFQRYNVFLKHISSSSLKSAKKKQTNKDRRGNSTQKTKKCVQSSKKRKGQKQNWQFVQSPNPNCIRQWLWFPPQPLYYATTFWVSSCKDSVDTAYYFSRQLNKSSGEKEAFWLPIQFNPIIFVFSDSEKPQHHKDICLKTVG